MSWIEIRERVGPEVLDATIFNDEYTWPTPEQAEFWQLVQYEEAFPLIQQQYLRYCASDPVLKKSHVLAFLHWSNRSQYLEKRSQEMGIDEINGLFTSPLADPRKVQNLDMVLGGPLFDVLLRSLPLKSADSFRSDEEILQLDYLPDLLSQQSAGFRAGFWWATWYMMTKKDNNEVRNDAVNLLTQQLHLQPPKII